MNGANSSRSQPQGYSKIKCLTYNKHFNIEKSFTSLQLLDGMRDEKYVIVSNNGKGVTIFAIYKTI